MADSRRVCVAFDDWKKPVFEKVLTEAGYICEHKPGLVEGTLSIMVEASDLQALQATINKANQLSNQQKWKLMQRKENNEDKKLH